jgi:hypothetical protein
VQHDLALSALKAASLGERLFADVTDLSRFGLLEEAIETSQFPLEEALTAGSKGSVAVVAHPAFAAQQNSL